MSIVIQKRRDTKANLEATNRIYAQGEDVLEIDTLKEKQGDGLTAYNDLPYKDTGSTTGTGNTIENVYADMAALYAGQADQTEGKFQYVADASAHSQVSSGFAVFEKRATSGGVEADYRLLSAFETNAVLTGSTYNAFTIASIDLSVAATVPTGSCRVQYENSGNTITHILFDQPFTNYLKGYAAAIGSNTLIIKLANKSTTATLIESITSFAFSNGSNKYYKVAITNSIPVASVAVNNVLEVSISVSPQAVAGGDMLAAIYDPTAVGGDAFAMNNMKEATTAKTTPVDADTISIWDSAASFIAKKLTWANLKATLKTYFDTLYNLYVHPNHSGDVTSVADGATTIANNAVTNAKAAQMAANTIKGNNTGSAANAADLTITQTKTLLVDRLEEDAAVTGTKNIDWTAYETFRYTLTGACNFSDTNLPASGSKTITIHMSGAFAPTWPSGWDTYIRGSYDTAVRNLIVAEYVKSSTPFWIVDISQPD